MARFISLTDFSNGGRLHISFTGYTSDTLQAIIDETEEQLLISLLGKGLYDLFIADWDSAPTGSFKIPAYGFIYEPFYIDESCCYDFDLNSRGIKYMLMNMIYFEYSRQQYLSNRVTGVKKTKQENSESAMPNDFGITEIYNNAIKTYKAIQHYVKLNISDYQEYKGKCKDYISWV